MDPCLFIKPKRASQSRKRFLHIILNLLIARISICLSVLRRMFTVIIKVINACKTSSVGLWEIHRLVKEWLNWSFKKVLWFPIERDVAEFSTVRRFQKNQENHWSSMKHALFLSIRHLLAWDRNSTRHETAWPSYNVAYEFIDLNGNLEDMSQFYDKCFLSISDCKESKGGRLRSMRTLK